MSQHTPMTHEWEGNEEWRKDQTDAVTCPTCRANPGDEHDCHSYLWIPNEED